MRCTPFNTAITGSSRIRADKPNIVLCLLDLIPDSYFTWTLGRKCAAEGITVRSWRLEAVLNQGHSEETVEITRRNPTSILGGLSHAVVIRALLFWGRYWGS